MARARVRFNERRRVWESRPYLGTDRVSGRPIRPYRSWPGDMDEEEAQEAADEWVAGIAPSAGSGSGRRLSDMLAGYLAKAAVYGLSPSTVATYESAKRCYVDPTVGGIPYDELEPWQVSTAWSMVLAGEAGRAPVAEATLRKAHATLSGAYSHWVSERLCRFNPMASVRAPRASAGNAFALEAADMGALLDALRDALRHGEPYDRAVAMAAYVALVTGERCGEVLAERRSDVRRRTSEMAVCGTMVEHPRLHRQALTKGKRWRNVAVTGEDLEEVDRFCAWADAGRGGPAPGSAPLVSLPGGGFMRPSTVSERFGALARRIGMPEGTTMHKLRHTHASWLLVEGMDVRSIQERLGHADVRTTLALYGHVMPGRDRAAAEAFGAAMREARGESWQRR